MLKLVMIDVAVCAALIMVAACAMVLRWRRRHGRWPLWRARRGTAAGPFAGRAGRRETPLVPGFSAGGEAQDQPVAVASQPDRLAGSQAGPARRWPHPDPAPARPAADPAQRWPPPDPAPGHPAARWPVPGPALGWPAPGSVPREVSHEPGPGESTLDFGPTEPVREPGPAGPAGPGGEPDQRGEPGQQATGPVTSSEKIGSYYDEADQAMSDYLTERGWPKEPDTP